MENKKVVLKIEDYEDKKSKTGVRYTRFKTNDGWMSCFEKELIAQLKEAEGKTAVVTIAIDDEKGFKNIRELHDVRANEMTSDDEAFEEKTPKPEKVKSMFDGENSVDDRQRSMYVAYAKDIFNEIWDGEEDVEEVMKRATSLVKYAINRF